MKVNFNRDNDREIHDVIKLVRDLIIDRIDECEKDNRFSLGKNNISDFFKKILDAFYIIDFDNIKNPEYSKKYNMIDKNNCYLLLFDMYAELINSDEYMENKKKIYDKDNLITINYFSLEYRYNVDEKDNINSNDIYYYDLKINYTYLDKVYSIEFICDTNYIEFDTENDYGFNIITKTYIERNCSRNMNKWSWII